MTVYSYSLANPQNRLPSLGLVVLQSDETIEHDFQRLIPSRNARQYVTRIPSHTEVRTDNLAKMAHDLPEAVSLFPGAVHLDAVGYGCTSATSVIGADEVAKLIVKGCNCKAVTDPLSAVIAACHYLKLKRLALLSPYVEEVSNTLRAALLKAGIPTPVFGSFEEAEETRVANIDKQSIIDAAVEIGNSSTVDAVFLSCTNLKTLDVIADIERRISKPVISSNSALVWHMCKLAGVHLHHENFGTLLHSSD